MTDADIIVNGLIVVFLAAGAIALVAGFVKGVTGFAMPMIMISGLGSVLPPEQALAGLIVPTLVANLWQALRQGMGEAQASARVHWRYLAVLSLGIAISAQFVAVLPGRTMFLILGVPVSIFAVLQLVGWRLRLDAGNRRVAELGFGAFSGAIGGLSGVWGPPTVMYLTALDTPKVAQVRVQGVIYGLGAVVLTAAHLRSGILNSGTVGLSLALTVPAVIGMLIGFAVQDRLDQARFRRITLAVLVIAGLNLVRRGLF